MFQGDVLQPTSDSNGNVLSTPAQNGVGLERTFDANGNILSFSVFNRDGSFGFRENYEYSAVGSDVPNLNLMLRNVNPFTEFTTF